jgi:hypothetical protein
MNIVKIYKEQDEIPTFIIEAEAEINSTQYVSLWTCKEEIYIDKTLIQTIHHKK